MNEQRNRYNGEIDRKSNLRNGFGIYQYENGFFQYQGQYKQGMKEGKGKLMMRDGSIMEGEFKDGEITGIGLIKYPNGNYYKGMLKEGDKDGEGEFYWRGDLYKGHFSENCKQGTGVMQWSNGDSMEGQWKDNKMDGSVDIKYNDGSYYRGDMVQNKKDGDGEYYQNVDSRYYKGQFVNDFRNGKGKEWYKDISYVYEGNYQQDQKCMYPNQMVVVDRSQQNFEYEIGSMALEIEVLFQFQGEDILDPVQPTAEEIQEMIDQFNKENKKNKNPLPMPDFNQPRMMKPDAILVDQEINRQIKIQFYQHCDNGDYSEQKEMLFDYRQLIDKKRKDNEALKQQILAQQNEEKEEKTSKKDKKGANLGNITIEELELTKLYEDVKELEVDTMNMSSENGKVVIYNIEFPTDFPQGKYVMVISDVTDLRVGGQIQQLKQDVVVRKLDDKQKSKKK